MEARGVGELNRDPTLVHILGIAAARPEMFWKPRLPGFRMLVKRRNEPHEQIRLATSIVHCATRVPQFFVAQSAVQIHDEGGVHVRVPQLRSLDRKSTR